MTFPGRFTDQLIPDKLDRISLSFLVDDLVIRRGGVAGNICFGLATLGLRPILVAAVGADWSDYRSWLERHGVVCDFVRVSDLAHTARFVCTTDLDMNQLASFYPGAMSEARLIELAPIAESAGGMDLVIVAPNDPEAMLRHTEECRDRGIPFAADPSQQLSGMQGPEIRRLITGARYLLSNDYEASLIEAKTGWSRDDVLEQVGSWIMTKGAHGCTISTRGRPDIEVAAAPEQRRADPTGVGDAFRAGFVAGSVWGLGAQRSAEVGSLLATYVLETVGTQEYVVHREQFLRRFADAFGQEAAGEIAAHLPVG